MLTIETDRQLQAETLKFLKYLAQKGGPDPVDDQEFTDIINHIKEHQIEPFREIFKDSLTKDTLIGHGFVKPFGYPGDFTIIHGIYTHRINPDPRFSKWDRFFQDQPGAKAVRNRKEYFIRCCKKLEESDRHDVTVLILGCGPATDVKEFYDTYPESRLKFHLIDFDQNALDFARKQNKQVNGNIEYFRINVLRYKPFKLYDLIWSAGLFDYFKEKHFIYLINKYLKYLSEDGEYVIGNFSHSNPTKRLMEVLSDWYLNHRSKYDLIRMAVEAEADENQISVDTEELGINMFLKIKNAANPITHDEKEKNT